MGLNQENVALGSDLSCITDLDPMMLEVSGRMALAQSLVRRLSTAPGQLIDDANYGYDLTGEINDDLSPTDVARMSSRIVSECRKDERVQSCTASVVFQANALLVVINVTDGTGPFKLTLAVTPNLVTLLGAA